MVTVITDTATASWRTNCLTHGCWLRSDYNNLMSYTTAHKSEIMDLHGWYWTQIDTKKDRSACFGFRLSQDKDIYGLPNPQFREYDSYSSKKYTTLEGEEKPSFTPQVHQIWFTVEFAPNEEEGGYLELEYMKDKAQTSAKFGPIIRKQSPVNKEIHEWYKPAATVAIEKSFKREENPWVVRDYLWTNGDYDAHITGTVCRKFEAPKGEAKKNKFEYAGKEWDKLYNLKFWYVMNKGDGSTYTVRAPKGNIPAKAGSKTSN